MDNNVNIFDNERLNDIYQKVVNGEITSTAGLNLTLDELFTMDKNTPKENYIKNAVIAFVVGGFLGSLSELLLRCYSMWLNLPRKESGVLVILTLITIASILTALGIFDTLVTKVKAALIIPITGFAHSMTSAALEYKNEGLVLGIGANIFKLAGTVILYGVVSVYIFGLIRLLVIGG